MDKKQPKKLLIKTNVRAGCGDEGAPPPPPPSDDNAPASLAGGSNRFNFFGRVRSFFASFR